MAHSKEPSENAAPDKPKPGAGAGEDEGSSPQQGREDHLKDDQKPIR